MKFQVEIVPAPQTDTVRYLDCLFHDRWSSSVSLKLIGSGIHFRRFPGRGVRIFFRSQRVIRQNWWVHF
jgi:hypothetical protein